MKILWLCNVPVSVIAKQENLKSVFGGWLDGAITPLIEDENNQLMYLFPNTNKLEGKIGNLTYSSFSPINIFKVDTKLIERFKQVLTNYNPDIVHIWGTELSHSLCMMKACEELGLLDKTVINIQGLCSYIAKHYDAGLPTKVMKRYTLKGLLKGFKNIESEKRAFERRGKLEIECLKMTKNVIGRTDWDRACTTQINPSVNYYHCNATLRNSFYGESWDLSGSQRYSMFVTQSNYAIKGFHKVLQAMPLIISQFPEAKLYSTGRDLLKCSFMAKIKQSSYEKYLVSLIKKYKLENNVEFLGSLSEQDIVDRYKKTHCHILSSSIENESNSLGEAMMLGVPSVASFVGGVTTTFCHNKDGYMYPFDAEYMLAYYVCKIFKDDSLAMEFSENSKTHSKELYDKETNANCLKDIYNRICGFALRQ